MLKNGEFDVKCKELCERPRAYEDEEVEALVKKDSCQTQGEFVLTLEVTQPAIV